MENNFHVSEFPPEYVGDSKNLAIDFDGVIHNNNLGYHDGTCYGEIIEGAYESLEYLAKHFRIIVFTAKAKPSRPLVQGKTGAEHVWDWLKSKNLAQFITEVTSEKPRAVAYIDDKAIRFVSWEKAIRDLSLVTQTKFA
jgi:hypothetical protein